MLLNSATLTEFKEIMSTGYALNKAIAITSGGYGA